ncbi:hypothetical protein SDJN03_24951, partial [Cucurbita argyrosperma subsp. sororia]
MGSLKYFLLSPFVFLCLSCTFANRVPNSDDGSGFDVGAGPGAIPTAGPGVEKGVSNVRAGPAAEGWVNDVRAGLKAGPKAGPGAEGWVSDVKAGLRAGPKAGPKAGPGAEEWVSDVKAGPRAGPKAGPGAEGWVSDVKAGLRAGPKAGPGAEGWVSNVKAGPTVGPRAWPGTEGGVSSSEGGVRRDVDPMINGLGLGLGVDIGYRSGFRAGLGGGEHWFGPGIGIGGGGVSNECTLGYVCPTYGRRGCDKFSYGNCDTYGFHPLMASMHLHEVEMKWAKGSKPAATPQNGV